MEGGNIDLAGAYALKIDNRDLETNPVVAKMLQLKGIKV